ncbi:MAG: nucleotide-binding protein, partial [Candidatus Microthrix sp.]|nr:nucleotide-binding protein [Candidatus Microthrix sp.]
MLQRWDVEPLVLDDLPSGGNTIIEELEHYQQGAEWGVVLLTPDDIRHRPKADGGETAGQTERGARDGDATRKARKVAGDDSLQERRGRVGLPSDIHGYVRHVQGARHDASKGLAKEMSDAGFLRRSPFESCSTLTCGSGAPPYSSENTHQASSRVARTQTTVAALTGFWPSGSPSAGPPSR